MADLSNRRVKIIVAGKLGVGKTSLLQRLATGKFSESPMPTVDEKFDCSVQVRGKQFQLQLQDTMGQEAFRQITQSFYQGCDGILLCYAVSDRDSFTKLPLWMTEIDKYCKLKKGRVPIILVGTKCDQIQSKDVDSQEAEAYANSQKIEQFVETSAKDQVNVEDPFVTLVECIMDGPVSTMKTNPEALFASSGVTADKGSSRRFPCNIL